jgi:hypothetical protein
MRLDAMLVAAVLRVALEGRVDAARAGVSARDNVRQVVSALVIRDVRGVVTSHLPAVAATRTPTSRAAPPGDGARWSRSRETLERALGSMATDSRMDCRRA